MNWTHASFGKKNSSSYARALDIKKNTYSTLLHDLTLRKSFVTYTKKNRPRASVALEQPTPIKKIASTTIMTVDFFATLNHQSP
jgi:hypothetical protein